MITRATLARLIAFAVLGVVMVGYTAVHYADLGRFVGMRGYYVVKMDLTDAGGLFPNADVTYRGVSVGRVGALRLTSNGVEADLNINDSAPPIPAHLHAAVADLSAVGEQYVDLRPATTQGPYLAGGSVIPASETQLPPSVTGLLSNVNNLTTSLPLPQLRTLMNALGTGFLNEGQNLGSLIDGNSSLVQAANSAEPQTTKLIHDSKSVLATQISETQALTTFGQETEQLAQTLDQVNPSLRQLIENGPGAATQIAGLITDNSVTLSALIANLLTTSEVTLTRGPALNELLSALPAAIAAGSTAITRAGARFGVELTFFNPQPCVSGYGGTVVRNGLDTSPGRPLNRGARCTAPLSSGINVRGSAHAPPGGPVPPAVPPGMAGLLGLGQVP